MGIVKEKIISWLKNLIKKLENNNGSKDENLICNDESSYNVLLPKEELEEEKKIYIDLLEKAIKHKKIINIGITGTYGAGKSTVIKSFLKENPQYSFLSISLLNFLEKNLSEEVTREALEKSILEQIFYSIKGEDIPLSKFKRIIKLNKLRYFLLTISIVCYIFIYFILKNNKMIKQIFEENKILDFFNLSASEMSMAFIFIAISIWWCYSLLIKIGTIKFSKFGGEIELKKSCEVENEKSILNNYLDEIIYCLESAKIDIFIIEDLDRFDNKNIFMNLKELNFIINNSKEIKNKITFIYAVKDDLFENSERSKFFDFIIPIVPILNSANSDGALLSKIKDKNIFTEGFLEDIFLYIHDMRLGLNIINEFNLYFSIFEKQKYQLGNGENKERNNKLLGIIVYKNIFPSEFSKLNFSNGDLYEIFNYRKSEIIKDLLENKNSKIIELTEKLEKVKGDYSSIEELKIFYILNILHENTSQILYKERWITLNERFSKSQLIEMFDWFLEKKIIKWYYNDERKFDVVIDKIDKEINTIPYKDKIKILEDKKEENEKKLTSELNILRKEVIEIKEKSLKELLQYISDKGKINLILGKGVDEINLKNEYTYKIKSFLIFNGYIDEYYFDYTSFIYPGALNEKDIEFLEKVSMQVGETENLIIYNYDKVLERLRNINSRHMLNYNLIKYVERKKEFELDYFKFIKFMAINYKESYQFIYNLIFEEIKDREKFFSKFVEYNNEIWENILEIRVNINEYLISFIEYLTIKEMEKINNASQNKFIENLQNFKNILQQNLTYEKLDEIYKKFKIKFNFLSSHEDAKKEIVDCIINNEMFEITQKNLETIYYAEKKEKLVSEELLTFLKEKSPKIWSYILSNSKIFLNEVYVNLESHKNENTEYVVEILETLNYNEQYEKELLQSLIETDLPVVDDIKIINNEVLRRSLVLGNKIRKNYNNLKEFVEIYQEGNYYDQTIKEIFLSNIDDYEPEIISEGEKLFQDILNSEIINSECFIRVLNIFDVEKVRVLEKNNNEIYREKLKYLISKSKIEYSKENFLLLSDILLETQEYVKFIEDKLEKITEFEAENQEQENQIIEKLLFSDNIKFGLFKNILEKLELLYFLETFNKMEIQDILEHSDQNKDNKEYLQKIEYLTENKFIEYSIKNIILLRNLLFESNIFIKFINENLGKVFKFLSSTRESDSELVKRIIIDSNMLESYKEVINFIKNDEFSKEIARKIIEMSSFDFKINFEILSYLIKTHSEIFKEKLVEIIVQQIKFHTPDEIIHLAELVFPGIKKKQILADNAAKNLLEKLKENKLIQDFKVERKYIYITF